MAFIAMKYSLLRTRAFCMNLVETLMSMRNLQTLSRMSPSSLIHIASSDSAILHAQKQYVYPV